MIVINIWFFSHDLTFNVILLPNICLKCFELESSEHLSISCSFVMRSYEVIDFFQRGNQCWVFTYCLTTTVFFFLFFFFTCNGPHLTTESYQNIIVWSYPALSCVNVSQSKKRRYEVISVCPHSEVQGSAKIKHVTLLFFRFFTFCVSVSILMSSHCVFRATGLWSLRSLGFSDFSTGLHLFTEGGPGKPHRLTLWVKWLTE